MTESAPDQSEARVEEIGWDSEEGRIFSKIWRPDGEPEAVVCLVHGIGEHSGRYSHVASAMQSSGLAFLAFDHIGHGRSEGRRGHVPSLEVHLENVAQILLLANEAYPGAKIFLYGHSMGGKLALNYAIRRSPELAGMIVTAPWLRLSSPLPKFKFAIMRIMDRLWPAFSLARGTDVSKLTSDQEVAENCGSDPLNHGRITARQLVVAIDAAQWAMDNADKLNIPLLLAHGSQDQVTCPDASREFSSAVPADCEFRLLDGIRHEPHHEPDRTEFIASLIAWIRSRL